MPKTSKVKATKIRVRNKVVGEVDNGVFKKKVRSSKHFLRIPPAICLDTQSFMDARAAGATVVEIHDKDTGLNYYASMDTIAKKGFALDRGFGRQLALNLEMWSTHKPEAVVVQEQAAVQARLF